MLNVWDRVEGTSLHQRRCGRREGAPVIATGKFQRVRGEEQRQKPALVPPLLTRLESRGRLADRTGKIVESVNVFTPTSETHIT